MKISNELKNLEENFWDVDKQIGDKNLNIRKLIHEKKDALAAKLTSEAALQRVHASQKGDDLVSVDNLVAPPEADIRIYRNEIAVLQEEKKAMEHLMKSKEVALLKAKIDLQNQIHELKRQIEICQEEKISLERELRKFKIIKNCVAVVLTDEWKDSDDKVMSVKRWLEEKRYLQGEIKRLRGELAISERVSKVQAQLKDKLKLRLRTLEVSLKHVLTLSTNQTTNSEQSFRNCSKSSVLQQPNSIPRTSANASISIKRSNRLRIKFISSENLITKNLQASPRKSPDDYANAKAHAHGDNQSQLTGSQQDGCEDMTSGFLYEILKEVIELRELQEEKDQMLVAQEEEIKLLRRRVDALTNAMEIEAQNMRRGAALREEKVMQKSEDTNQKYKLTSIFKRYQIVALQGSEA